MLEICSARSITSANSRPAAPYTAAALPGPTSGLPYKVPPRHFGREDGGRSDGNKLQQGTKRVGQGRRRGALWVPRVGGLRERVFMDRSTARR